jgi:peptide-methionine (R)-S-oxide reductase
MKTTRLPEYIGCLLTLCAVTSLLIAQERPTRQATQSTDKGRRAGGESESNRDSKLSESGKIEKVVRTEKEWRKLLTREQFKILRMKGTERPFRNKYDKHFEPGVYACAACGLELFSSTTKFNSGCGWPAFFAAQAGDRVILQPDYTLGMVRTEVICARCDSHLGHVFRDAPQTPTGNRFCINSVSLKFIPAKSASKEPSQTTGKRSRVKDKRESSATTSSDDNGSN